MVEYKSFLDMPAPEGYVPGLGRGAMGFTTRTDIGPARSGFAEDAMKASSSSKQEGEDEPDDDGRFQDPDNEEGLFSSTANLNAEDEEADSIYQKVDLRMEERRKKQREAREKEVQESAKDTPKVSERFLDLKRALTTITDDQWENLPEVGDLTRKYKRQRKLQQQQKRFYNVPDSLLESAQNQGTVESSIDPTANSTIDGGMTDFRSISSARDKMLGMKLDQASETSMSSSSITRDASGGFSTIDPKGYLTSLATSNNTAGNVGDIRRSRSLLQAVVTTSKRDPQGWIGLARIDELANRMQKALSVIEEGCRYNPKSEDVWLENIRLNESASSENAKRVAARAVQQLPKSINLWLRSYRLEKDTDSQKKVIRMALENIPTSDTLWKAAVQLESDPSDATLLLREAVERVPLSEDLWLALARLETPTNARKVLNKARKHLKASRAVWIAAGKLEEQDSASESKISKIIERGVRTLETEGYLPDRAQWISEAESCEKENFPLTCHAIINATIGLNLEDEDRELVLLEEGQACAQRNTYETARAIYQYTISQFTLSKKPWLALCQLDKIHGEKNTLFSTLELAVKAHSNSEEFWLMYAKEKRLAGDIIGAKNILERAFEENPNNEDIWLSAVGIEAENKNFDRARVLLQRARIEAGTERVWFKSVTLERQLKNDTEAIRLVNEGLEHYPASDKLWMQRGQIYESLGQDQRASSSYRSGLKVCPKSVSLWLLLARLEERQGESIKARSTLEKAALSNPKMELLWVERITLEKRLKNKAQMKVLLARSLQELPTSGLLWSESILDEPPKQRTSKMREATAACRDDSVLLTTIAREFWRTGKTDKAESWFKNSIQRNPDNGDAWVWYYKFLNARLSSLSLSGALTQDAEKSLDKFLNDFKITEPRHGYYWPRFTKDPNNFGKKSTDILKLAASIFQ